MGRASEFVMLLPTGVETKKLNRLFRAASSIATSLSVPSCAE